MTNKKTEIKSISDAIEYIGQQEGKFWFRGHADANWDLVPSVFRPAPSGGAKYYNESALLSEFVRRHPEAKEKHSNTFELLTYAQHYGLPTRLLDWTENLLVALYFATEGYENIDGELILLDSKPCSMDDTIFFNKRLKDIIENQAVNDFSVEGEYHTNEYFIEIYYKYFHSIETVREIKFPLTVNNTKMNIEWFSKNEDELHELFYSADNNLPIDIGAMLTSTHRRFARRINHFSGVKLSNSFLHYHPPLLNERLIAQKGCFTIHTGKIVNNTEAFRVERKIKSNERIIKSCIIPADSKRRIKDELNLCGITKSTLFPELEYQTADIRNDCKY